MKQEKDKEKKKDKAGSEPEKRKKLFWYFRWGAFPSVAAMFLFGVLLLAIPSDSIALFGIIMGALFCAVGVLLIVSAFTGPKAGFLQLIPGVGLIGFAVWLFLDRDRALFVLLLALASLLILRSIFGMFHSLSIRIYGGYRWQVQLVLALADLVGSIILFFDLFGIDILMLVLGILMLVDALSETVSLIMAPSVRRAKSKLQAEKETKREKKEDKKEEAPVEETSGKGKKRRPVEQPIEEPVAPPAEQPAPKKRFSLFRKKEQAPEEAEAEQPIEQPAEQPAEQPIEQPAEQPAEQPVEQPVAPPAEQPAPKKRFSLFRKKEQAPEEAEAEQPAEEPVEEPIEEPVAPPAEQTAPKKRFSLFRKKEKDDPGE